MRCTQAFWSVVAAGGLVLGLNGCRNEREAGEVTTETSQGTSVAPSSDMAKQMSKALVRVVNAIPGAAADIYADDSVAFSDVAYKSVSEWKELPDDYFGFRIVKAGTSVKSDTLAENREKLMQGDHYTIIALRDPDIRPSERDEFGERRVLHDGLAPVTNGKARVRFINALPGSKAELSFFQKGNTTPLVEGVNYSHEGGWIEVAPWSGTLEVRTEDQALLTSIPKAAFDAGKSYTFVITGTARKVDVVRIEDDVKPAYTRDTQATEPKVPAPANY